MALGQWQALDSLKGALTSAAILAFPSYKDIVANPFHLQTDANNTGLGVVLTQVYSAIGREELLGNRKGVPGCRGEMENSQVSGVPGCRGKLENSQVSGVP